MIPLATFRCLWPAAALMVLGAGVLPGALVTVEDFESDLEMAPAVKAGWEAKAEKGSTSAIARTASAAKIGSGAGEVAFEVKPGGWALVQKKVEGAEWLGREPRAISFWLKGGGSGELTVELEESYTFKWRKKIPLTDTEWRQVTIKFPEFVSEGKKEMSPVDLVVLKFVGFGGSLKFLLDDIQVECSDKPAGPAPQAAAAPAPMAGLPLPAAAETAKKGFVRRVSENGRYLLHDDGSPFIPMGHNRYNIADGRHLPRGSTLETYLRDMAASGQNTLRIWVEGDEDTKFWLEPQTGVFNEEQAKRIDEVFDLAARYDIHIILTAWDTWRITHSLPKAAYVMSGDMSLASDFITQPRVHELQKKKWKYMIDRWASRRNLLAWELLNEIDVFNASLETEFAWVEKIGAFVRDNDPERHLITVSFSARENEAVLRSPIINLIGVHYYGNNPERGVGDIATMTEWLLHRKNGGFWRYKKPALFTELGLAGSGYTAGWVRHMMWSSLAAGAAGPSMRWTDQGQWGNCSPEEYGVNAAVRRFMDFVNWRAFLEAPLTADRVRSLSGDVRAFGVTADCGALLWVEGIAQDKRKYAPEVQIEGLSPGTFALFFFNLRTGEAQSRQFLEVDSEAIRVIVPEFADATMGYLERIEPAPATAATPASKAMAARHRPAFTGDQNGRIRCAHVRRPSQSIDAAETAFEVDASVPAWHTRFPTRISDGAAPRNRGDLSARVHTAWDDESFYISVRVRDEKLVVNRPPDQAYNMDSVELYFDSTNDKKRRQYSPEHNRQVLLLADSVTGGGPQVYVAGKPAGSATVELEKGGYVLRARIPFAALGFRPAPGKVIGFDLQLNDCDDPQVGRETALAWTGGDNLDWCDPSVFGELEFVGAPGK